MSASPNKKGLSKGEKQKLFVFLIVLFALANIFAFSLVQEKFQDTARNLKKLRADLSYSRIWIGDRALWTQREAWLAKTQPKLSEVGDAGQGSARLLESLQQAAKKNNLAIVSQSLQEPRGTPFYREVSVQLSVTGSLESLCRWLSEVEQPDLFQAISRFSLKCDGPDGSKMRCEMTVARWYSLK
ncbi:Type II secretion system (T2SS), protein M subtype b [Verrucomicrobium sp. GAS474]|uniref:type 4a pilus biogenesis protein PilO n=1 Tax=Verrucomicrobium sp. GAS474 TaxID=1882831 RepID=UPI00087B1CEF|nr:type 4a pilus biogenesis protein PilO [Verrucomicrobium sp. GAS474]SDU06664.1 Type II secretion system (T2SS), protein M subtype b [Verrucomicrobium sp. GAS474]